MSKTTIVELTGDDIGARISVDTSDGNVKGTLIGWGWGGDSREDKPPLASLILRNQPEAKGLPLDTTLTILKDM